MRHKDTLEPGFGGIKGLTGFIKYCYLLPGAPDYGPAGGLPVLKTRFGWAFGVV